MSGTCPHGSMYCPECEGADDAITAHGPSIHGIECYEAWYAGLDCPHEEADQ